MFTRTPSHECNCAYHRSWPGLRSHKQEGQDRTWSPKRSMAPPHLHVVMPARRRRSCTAFMKEAGRMAPWPTVGTSLKASITGTLLRLEDDNGTVSWGGSIEAIQPMGTLSDVREALLCMGLALTNLSRLREGRSLSGEARPICSRHASAMALLCCSQHSALGGLVLRILVLTSETGSTRTLNFQ